MFRYLLYILIALSTFGLGVVVSEAYQASVNRIVHVRPLIFVNEPPETPARVQIKRPIAQSKYVPGVVAVYFTTNVNGEVTYTHVIVGDPSFSQQGLEATQQMKFSRRKRRGHLISTEGLVIYKFLGRRRVVLDLETTDAHECSN